jgi:hypothetical protein
MYARVGGSSSIRRGALDHILHRGIRGVLGKGVHNANGIAPLPRLPKQERKSNNSDRLSKNLSVNIASSAGTTLVIKRSFGNGQHESSSKQRDENQTWHTMVENKWSTFAIVLAPLAPIAMFLSYK